MFKRQQGVTRAARSGSAGFSFIGAEMIVNGDVSTGAHLQVDGRIDGDVRCVQLCQSEKGAIAGNIHAEQVRIAGLVEGRVEAGTIVVEGTARIMGDISYDRLSMAAGARIEGRLARRRALEADALGPVEVRQPLDPAMGEVVDSEGDEELAIVIATPTNDLSAEPPMLPLVERKRAATQR